MLLVLDDGAGLGRVEPLLPGAAGSTVLVISRRQLAARRDASVRGLDILRAIGRNDAGLVFLDASALSQRRRLGPY